MQVVRMSKQSNILKKYKYVKTEQLLKEDFSYYKINQLVNEKKLKKINGSTFENLVFDGDEHEFSMINAYIHKGIICLLSAAVFYGLSQSRPYQSHVAIPNKYKVALVPEDQPIRFFYFSKARYDTAIIKQHDFHIYDMEKTVIDCLYFRNKIGLDESISILKAYLNLENRDLNKLIDYAKKLRTEKLLMTYLEVLL